MKENKKRGKDPPQGQAASAANEKTHLWCLSQSLPMLTYLLNSLTRLFTY